MESRHRQQNTSKAVSFRLHDSSVQTSFSPMSRALVVRLSRLRDIGRPHVWSTGRIPLPFPPAPCHFAGFGGERNGRAELDEYCKTQTNGRDSLSTFPANADVLGASTWVDRWQAVPPVPKYLQIPTPPLQPWEAPAPCFSQRQWTAYRPKRYVAGTVSYDAAWSSVICPNL